MDRGRHLFLWFVSAGLIALALIGLGFQGGANEAPARASPEPRRREGRACSLARLQEHVEAARRAYAGLTDYTATMKKQERVGGELLPPEEIEVRFRKPHDVYMKWIDKMHHGREVLYGSHVAGGKLLVHNGSFPDVTLELDPNGALATHNTRHSIQDAGLGFIINRLAADLERAAERDPGALELREFADDRGPCFAARFPEADRTGYYAADVEVCMDTALRLPMRVIVRGAGNELLESSEYTDLRVDVGLTDRDFDRANADYRF